MTKSYKDDARCGKCFEYLEVIEHPIREGYGTVTLRCPKCGKTFGPLGPMSFELPKPERKKRAKST